jgi:hypothetical protein
VKFIEIEKGPFWGSGGNLIDQLRPAGKFGTRSPFERETAAIWKVKLPGFGGLNLRRPRQLQIELRGITGRREIAGRNFADVAKSRIAISFGLTDHKGRASLGIP